MTTTLVTGANGFVGAALCRALRHNGTPVVAAVRHLADHRQTLVGDINAATDWSAALKGCSLVVHLAARVHVMSDKEQDPLLAYREVNVDGTLNLAKQAVQAGVKRFVFVSSIKVHGESTHGQPFRASDVPCPVDPYGQSKLEAEIALQRFGAQTGLEIVIVRPPLVYGPGVKANFRNLIKLVRLGFPLPFGRVNNYRSMVALDNLVDLLIVCSTHRAAPGEVFLVSDGEDIGTAQLVRKIARAMNKRLLLVPVPVGFLLATAKMLGKAGLAERLTGSLQVDITQTQARLEWKPVITVQRAIDMTVAHFFMAEEET